jgi:hypothetical protein
MKVELRNLKYHRVIPDDEIPRVLRKPLKFGCREQIEALQDLECRIQEMATEKALIESGDLKRYHVYVTADFNETITVYAVSKQDAKEKAMAGFDFSNNDVEFYFNARKATP